MNSTFVQDKIYLKQLLESEQKYLKQLIEFPFTESKNLRETLLVKNLEELSTVNNFLRINCKHNWINEDDDITIVTFCNNCGLQYN